MSKDVDHGSFLDKAHKAIRRTPSRTGIFQNSLSDMTVQDAIVRVFVKLGYAQASITPISGRTIRSQTAWT
jgi:hypothetical protein